MLLVKKMFTFLPVCEEKIYPYNRGVIMKKAILFSLFIFLFSMSFGFADGKVSSDLQNLMVRGNSNKIPVMVRMTEDFDVASLMSIHSTNTRSRQEAKAMVCETLEELSFDSQKEVRTLLNGMTRSGNVSNVHHFWLINAVSLHATPEVIEQLAATPGVEYIYHDRTEVMISPMADAQNTNWGLAFIGSDKLNAQGINGEGVTVAVLDTGVDLDHSTFNAGQVNTGLSKSFVFFEFDAEDGNGHGTHCATTIAGQGVGVAIKAEIIAGKVLSSSGSGSLSGIVQGIEHATKHADIASMSLGGTDNGSVNDMERAVRKGVDAGVVFVIAAGNSGPNSFTIGTPGCEPKAITVGALADVDGNHTSGGQSHDIARFSSRGADSTHNANKPDVTAPGVNIFAGWKNGQFNTISGTSMATPHVAGVVALMLQVNPNLTPAEVKSILQDTCKAPIVPQNDTKNVYGAGLVDAEAAVAAALAAK